MSADNHYVLISAGGAGTRLWPLSRNAMPKQFQRLGTEETLLQHMATLTEQVIPLDHIYVMVVEEFVQIVQDQLPNLPRENILIEPARLDNGPAIILAMLQLRRRNPLAIAAVLWADHLIKDAEAFANMLKGAFQAAEEHPEQLVTIGAKPTFPDTGMGYIQMGQELKEYDGVSLFKVKRFLEKPDLPTATKFVSSWEYLWNVGYKIMNANAFIESQVRVKPELRSIIERLDQALENETEITAIYQELPKLSVEYLFTPFLTDILVIPADMGWSDVGNWNILHEMLRTDESVVTRGPVKTINTTNSLIFAKEKLIAVVGLNNIIIVDAGDTILVMSKENAQDIKAFHTTLSETNPELL